MTPNPYEAPVCQGTKEVRRKIRVFRYWVHAQSIALGVTDLISSSGSAGACPAPNTYRGSSPTAAEALAGGAVAGCLPRPRNDTVPSCRPNQSVGLALPQEPLQLVPGSGEGQHTSNAST